MKKKFLLVVLILNIVICSIAGGAVYATQEDGTSKISEKVLMQMKIMSDTDKITVYVILEDIDNENAMDEFKEAYPKEYAVYFEEQTEENALSTNQNIGSIQSSIQAKREVYCKLYSDNNQSILGKYLNKENQLFISKYSPLCIVEATKYEIELLTQDIRVTNIQLFVLEKAEEELATANQVTRANYNRDTYGLTGEGVRIGQIEPGVPEATVTNLNWNNVTINPDTTAESPHASQVASIMVGQANGLVPDAELFSTGFSTTADFYTRIEWLLDQGVNVINMSAGFSSPTGEYDTICQWIDHIAVMHDVHFVKSAGNEGTNGGLITSPGMAYNVITVGGFDDRNTVTHTDDIMAAFSSFEEAGTSGRPEKPNLIAPAVNIENLPGSIYDITYESGTSFAAPQVTGTIAQLIDYVPSLATKQTAVGAILLASTFNKVSTTNYGITGSAQISDREGSGKLDARAARSIPYYGNYWSQTIYTASFPYTMTDYISSSSSQIRVAIFWLKRNTSLSEQVSFTDLDLRVYDPYGNFVASSTTVSSNFEIVEFDPTVSGQYSIRISRVGTSTSTREHVGIAIW